MARVAVVVAALLSASVEVAWAHDPGVAAWLQWSATPGPNQCLDADAFSEKVERSLGRSPTVAAKDAHVTVAVRIERSPAAEPAPRWWGEIRVRGDDGLVRGSRQLDRAGPSCQALVDALALVTSLVLSDDGAVWSPGPDVEVPEPGVARPEPSAGPPVAERSSPAPAAETPPGPTPRDGTTASVPSPPSLRAEAVPRPSQAHRWKLGAGAGLAFGLGLLPAPALGATASVFVGSAAGRRVFVAAGAWSQQSPTVGAGQGVALDLAWLGAGVCPVGRDGRAWTWRACAQGEVGRLRAVGFGFILSTSEERLTVDVAAGAEVERRLLGPLRAGLSVDLVVPLIRDRIAYAASSGQTTAIFRREPVAAVGGLRLSCEF